MSKTAVEYAAELYDLGFCVLPCPLGGKLPDLRWKQYQSERPSRAKTLGWFKGNRRNYFVLCGAISDCAVVDCDDEESIAWWLEKLPELELTAQARTSKGRHFYLRLAGRTVSNHSFHRDGLNWDIRGEGGGVVAPPSVHASGHIYEWLVPLSEIQEAPDSLWELLNASEGQGDTNDGQRSMLAHLLLNPPEGPGSGRNDWMARVAGHYAAACYPNRRDLYDVQTRLAYDQLDHDDFEEAEYEKTVESIWSREKDKGVGAGPAGAAELADASGWLIGGGGYLMSPVKGDEALESWGNFDLEALGVMHDESERIWDVRMHRPDGNHVDDMLSSRDLADSRRLRGWLAKHGVSILAPVREIRGLGDRGDRLVRYLQAQKPPQFEIIPTLGWHAAQKGFVTLDNVIRADGVDAFSVAKPAPVLRHTAKHFHYGFADLDEVREVLAEVLTFHDPVVCSVFGAWWAAAFLKGAVHERGLPFPLMALQAPSESGKTSGFFAMMVELSGNGQGPMVATGPGFRDAVGAHRGGIVWIDDRSDLDDYLDLLRQSTNEGVVVKKAEDRTRQATTRLVAPILLAGEALGLEGEKALLDRVILITNIPAPTQRRSVTDPTRLQWNDIQDLNKRYDHDLTQLAGTVVQLALRQAHRLDELRALRPPEGRRFGDKLAVLRMGARMLAGMTGDAHHVDVVDRWIGQQESVSWDNKLTLEILPEALRVHGAVTTPEMPDPPQRPYATPVLVRPAKTVEHHPGVWIHIEHLADWWSHHRRGKVIQRVESAAALRQQLDTIGVTKGVSKGDSDAWRYSKIDHGRSYKLTYYRLPNEVARCVLDRAEGRETPEEAILDTLWT